MTDQKYSGWGPPGKKPPPPPPQRVPPPPSSVMEARLQDLAKALEEANLMAVADKGVIQKLTAENAELMAANRALSARNAEVEAYLANVEQPLEPQPGLPPAPGAQPAMRDILANAGPALDPEPDPEAELAQLRARARELGVEVDMRWGYKRLAREIAAAEDK